jgi:hypothetical protein
MIFLRISKSRTKSPERERREMTRVVKRYPQALSGNSDRLF